MLLNSRYILTKQRLVTRIKPSKSNYYFAAFDSHFNIITHNYIKVKVTNQNSIA